jgi:hypothetical protein
VSALRDTSDDDDLEPLLTLADVRMDTSLQAHRELLLRQVVDVLLTLWHSDAEGQKEVIIFLQGAVARIPHNQVARIWQCDPADVSQIIFQMRNRLWALLDAYDVAIADPTRPSSRTRRAVRERATSVSPGVPGRRVRQ